MDKKYFADFSAKKIALAGIFTALSFALTFLEFPLFPAAPFLKLDFSFAALFLGAYILGPLYAEIIIAATYALHIPFGSTGGIGELANFIVANCFIVVPSLVYLFKKGLPAVIASMVCGSVLAVFAALLANRFLLFPLYMGGGAAAQFKKYFWILVAFNSIKCAVNGLITVLLYKRLKRALFNLFKVK